MSKSSVADWAPMVSSGFNMIGNIVGSIFGQKVPPPQIPPPPPPQPPIPVYVPVPGPPGPAGEVATRIEYRTHPPLPPPTAAPETLTYLGIIAIVLCVLFLLACSASGIGFFFWQSQKAEKERRSNERNSSDSYMESGGRRRRRGSRSSYSGTSGTRTSRSTHGRTRGR